MKHQTEHEGRLEIFHETGTIYFHSSFQGGSLLRIQGGSLLRISSLPAPIPHPNDLLDINFRSGKVSWCREETKSELLSKIKDIRVGIEILFQQRSIVDQSKGTCESELNKMFRSLLHLEEGLNRLPEIPK